MKLLTAFRLYPKAVLWSIVLSSALIMEGYDTAAVGSCEKHVLIHHPPLLTAGQQSTRTLLS